MFIALFLLAAASGAYVAGRNRALRVAGGEERRLRSRPRMHGLWLAFTTTFPPLTACLAWLAVRGAWIQHHVFSRLQGVPAELPQKQALWQDIAALGAGKPAHFPDALREQGAVLYRSFVTMELGVLGLLLLALGSAGFIIGMRRISVHFPARERVETVLRLGLMAASAVAVLTTLGIVLSLLSETLRFFTFVSPFEFLFGLSWTPQQMAFRADQAGGTAAFGIVPLLAGTLLITVIALSVAAPLGLLAALYLSDYASPAVRTLGKPVLEILAGIPTVVYGFFAALKVAPFLRQTGEALGLSVASESALAAGLVMGIMIVPFISSLADDVLNAVPQNLRDGSLALGATPSETMRRVVLPAALPGIVSALLLAMSRAVGETMIVIMAAGLAANLSFNPLDAVTTITVQIATLLTGDQEFDSPKTLAAFALGLVLFLATLALNLIALRVVNKYRNVYD